jgi:HEAT repeat protein
MRQITERTREILNKLYQPKKLLDRFGSKKKNTCDLLAMIQDCGEPAVIPDILLLIFSRDINVSQKAAKIIDSLMNSLSAKDLIWFDQYFRQRTMTWSYYDSEWSNLKPKKITFFTRFPGSQVSLLALLSLHNNGFIREEALKRLCLMEDGREIPYILLRLNDWVDQVRVIAYKGIESRVTPKLAQHFISNLYLVGALARFKRYDHSHFIESIHSFLTMRELQDTIKKALLADDVYTRRECYKIVLKSEEPLLTEVVNQGVKDSDVIIRNWTIRALKSVSDFKLLKKHLTNLENDPFMPNRREVLNIFLNIFPEIADRKLHNALFDHHPSIRYDARYFLSKKSKIEFSEIYREAIKKPENKTIVGTISGMGETGSKDDAGLLISYTIHRTAKIRKVSIKAIARLAAEDYCDLFQAMIKDDSPRVSREAALALLQCRYQSIFSELWDLFERTEKTHIKKNILRIASGLSKWERIFYYIKAITVRDENISKIANDYLNRWLFNFNRSFTKPTSEQKDRINNALKLHAKIIGENRKQAIEFNMKTF